MGNVLEEKDKPEALSPPSSSPKLPVPFLRGMGTALSDYFAPAKDSGESRIPNASLIYGVGAAGLMVFAVYHLLVGQWVTFFLLMVLAVCLFGFAYHFLRNPDA